MKVYGPYPNKTGRKHVIILFDDGSRKTTSYAKYLMEQLLGRELDPIKEQVDHINDDFTDDNIENLQILPRLENIKKSAKGVTTIDLNCILCGITFKRRLADHNRSHIKSGPFCSKSCSGKAIGFKTGQHIVQKLTNDDIEQIKKLYDQGISSRKIGERFNVHYSTILYHVNK